MTFQKEKKKTQEKEKQRNKKRKRLTFLCQIRYMHQVYLFVGLVSILTFLFGDLASTGNATSRTIHLIDN